MGFIGYRRVQNGRPEMGPETGDVVRIYMECRDEAAEVRCGSVVDVVFPPGAAACELRGIDEVLALKKFYKLVFSLEERARERGNDWRAVMQSPESLLEHLRYTRNARDFGDAPEPAVVRNGVARQGVEDAACSSRKG